MACAKMLTAGHALDAVKQWLALHRADLQAQAAAEAAVPAGAALDAD